MQTKFFVGRKLLLIAALGLVSACSRVGGLADPDVVSPTIQQRMQTGLALLTLPPPSERIDVAVYSFEDLTGQQRENENFSSFSKAVGQGNAAVLVDILTEVGNDSWFNVVERTEVQSLLSERSLIDQTNTQFRGAKRSLLPPIRFAGILLKGGIVNYDSNVQTSGIGARMLGIGETVEYRRDEVSVALRAVSVATGEALTSVTTNKIVYSALVQAGVFKFVSTDRILEFETGFSRNEPVGLAVRQAIELAVFEMIKEGELKNLWQFADPAAGSEALSRINPYTAMRRGAMNG